MKGITFLKYIRDLPRLNLTIAPLSPCPAPLSELQFANLQTELPQVIVAMITSRMLRAQHREIGGHDAASCPPISQLSTLEGQQSGLLTDSVVMTDNLATVAETEIDRIIGTLPMGHVDAALRHTLEL